MSNLVAAIEPAEAPATPDEERLADYLAAVSNTSSKSIVDPPWTDRPDLRDRALKLAQSVHALHRCASSLFEKATVTFGGESPPDASSLSKSISLNDDLFPGEFRILKKLGRGAFGEVWLADDLQLPRQVAIKTLAPGGDADKVAKQLAALRRDARMLTQFRHPHVVQVLLWKQRGSDHFLILEYVDGGSLDDRIRQEPSGRLDWATAARYIADVGDGLLAVHKQGIVHRDIKPANILWDKKRDEALLTDFGIATNLANAADYAGTPNFMAPEAFDTPASTAQDVYSLAATLFCLTTGEAPFPGTDWTAIRSQSRAGLPQPDARCEGMPEPIERLIRSGLNADPEMRPSLTLFVSSVRAELNRLMADSMSTISPSTTKGLRLAVSRLVSGRYEAVTSVIPKTVPTRDIKRVPKPAPSVPLRTGDTIAVEVVADRTGYLVVFNIGPTGNLDLLHPEMMPPAGSSPNVQAGERLWIDGLVISEPAGRERLFAVWSAKALALASEELRDVAEPPKAVVATRDIRRVQQAVSQMPATDRLVEVIELDHEDSAGGLS